MLQKLSWKDIVNNRSTSISKCALMLLLYKLCTVLMIVPSFEIMFVVEQSHSDGRFHHPHDLCQRDADVRDYGEFRPVLEEGFPHPELMWRVNRSFDVFVLRKFVPNRQGLRDNVIRYLLVRRPPYIFQCTKDILRPVGYVLTPQCVAFVAHKADALPPGKPTIFS